MDTKQQPLEAALGCCYRPRACVRISRPNACQGRDHAVRGTLARRIRLLLSELERAFAPNGEHELGSAAAGLSLWRPGLLLPKLGLTLISGSRRRRCRIAQGSTTVIARYAIRVVPTRGESGRSNSPPSVAARLLLVHPGSSPSFAESQRIDD